MKSKYAEDRYNWLKEHHVCVQCGKADAAYGFVSCPECLEKDAQRAHDSLSKRLEDGKKRRTKYRIEGKCSLCGKQIEEDNNTTKCNKCRTKINLYQRRYYYAHKHRSTEEEQAAKQRQIEAGKKNLLTYLEKVKTENLPINRNFNPYYGIPKGGYKHA